jgi:hypothetical protein
LAFAYPEPRNLCLSQQMFYEVSIGFCIGNMLANRFCKKFYENENSLPPSVTPKWIALKDLFTMRTQCTLFQKMTKVRMKQDQNA